MTLNIAHSCFRTFLRRSNKVYGAVSLSKQAIISCKRSKFDFFDDTSYNHLDEIPLASKGWTHHSSIGDHFTINGDETARDTPCVHFDEVSIDKRFQNALDKMDVHQLTAFQAQVIPVIRKSGHVLIAAETGCGKTLAYLLPLIERLEPTEQLNTPQVLVLVPNRELANQIGKVVEELCSGSGELKTKVIVGGRTKRIMLEAEHTCVDILVATPGAISKLTSVGLFKMHNVKHTVIDEADTLADDSFADRMESLILRVPQSQIVLVAATLPRKLPAVLEPIMDSLVQMKSERLHRPLMNITQKFCRLSKSAKPTNLLSIAKKCKDPMIIFTNRNETCNWLAMFLRENGLACANINGDMNYAIRKVQWADFQAGAANILSATDVGSRGLDATSVKQIINYDFPLYAADYVHRVGRIGRLGSPTLCKVTHFISAIPEIQLVQNIETAIRTGTEMKHIDGNIKRIIQKRLMRMSGGSM